MPMSHDSKRGLIIFDQPPKEFTLSQAQLHQLESEVKGYLRQQGLPRTEDTYFAATRVLLLDALPRGIALDPKHEPFTAKTNIKRLIKEGEKDRFIVKDTVQRAVDTNRTITGSYGALALPEKLYQDGVENLVGFDLRQDIQAASRLAKIIQSRKNLLKTLATSQLGKLPKDVFPDASLEMFRDRKTPESDHLFEQNMARFMRNTIFAYIFGHKSPFLFIEDLRNLQAEDVTKGFTSDQLPAIYGLFQANSVEERAFVQDLFSQTRDNLLSSITWKEKVNADDQPLAKQRDITYNLFSRYLLLSPAALEEPTLNLTDPRSTVQIRDKRVTPPAVLEYLLRPQQALRRLQRYQGFDNFENTIKRGLQAWKNYERDLEEQKQLVEAKGQDETRYMHALQTLQEGRLPATFATRARNLAIDTYIGKDLARDIRTAQRTQERMESLGDLVITLTKAQTWLQEIRQANGGSYPVGVVLPQWILDAYREIGKAFRQDKITRQNMNMTIALRELSHDIFNATDKLIPEAATLENPVPLISQNWAKISVPDVHKMIKQVRKRLEQVRGGKKLILPTDTLISLLEERKREIDNADHRLPSWKIRGNEQIETYLEGAKDARDLGQKVIEVPSGLYEESLRRRIALLERIGKAKHTKQALIGANIIDAQVSVPQLEAMEKELDICLSVDSNYAKETLLVAGELLVSGAQDNNAPSPLITWDTPPTSKYELLANIEQQMQQHEATRRQARARVENSYKLKLLRRQYELVASPFFPEVAPESFTNNFWAAIHFRGLVLQAKAGIKIQQQRLTQLQSEFGLLQRKVLETSLNTLLTSTREELASLQTDPATTKFLEKMDQLGFVVNE